MSALGGKWINEHTCPLPKVFGAVVTKEGRQWECDCGKRYEVRLTDTGRTWVLVESDQMSRRDVLDALAVVMVPTLAGHELAEWRLHTHQVLCGLEGLGLSAWQAGTAESRR
jgi:hypothetical protein